MMMLAFLVDQVQQLCCPLFQAAWHKMKTECHLWEEIRNYFHMLVFDSMEALLRALLAACKAEAGLREFVVTDVALSEPPGRFWRP